MTKYIREVEDIEMGWKPFSELQARDLIASKAFFCYLNDSSRTEPLSAKGFYLFISVMDSSSGLWFAEPYYTFGSDFDDFYKTKGRQLEVEVPTEEGQIRRLLPSGHMPKVKDSKCFVIRTKDSTQLLPCFLQAKLEEFFYSPEGIELSKPFDIVTESWNSSVERQQQHWAAKFQDLDEPAREVAVKKMMHDVHDFMKNDLSKKTDHFRRYSPKIHQSLDEKLFNIEDHLVTFIGNCPLPETNLEEQYEQSFPLVECEAFEANNITQFTENEIKYFKRKVANSGQRFIAQTYVDQYCDIYMELERFLVGIKSKSVSFSLLKGMAELLGAQSYIPNESAIGIPYLNKNDFRAFKEHESQRRARIALREKPIPCDELDRTFCLEGIKAAEELASLSSRLKNHFNTSAAMEFLAECVTSLVPNPERGYLFDVKYRLQNERPKATPEETEAEKLRAEEKAKQKAQEKAKIIRVIQSGEQAKELLNKTSHTTVRLKELLNFESGVKLKDVQAGDLILRESLSGKVCEGNKSELISIFEPIERLDFEIPSTIGKEIQDQLPQRPVIQVTFVGNGQNKEFNPLDRMERWESLIVYEKEVDLLRLKVCGLKKHNVSPGFLHYILRQESGFGCWMFPNEMLRSKSIEIPPLDIQDLVIVPASKDSGYMNASYEISERLAGIESGRNNSTGRHVNIPWGNTQYDVVNELLTLAFKPQINVTEIVSSLHKMWDFDCNSRMHRSITSSLSPFSFPMHRDGNFMGGFFYNFERKIESMHSAINTLFDDRGIAKNEKRKSYTYAQADLAKFGQLIFSSVPRYKCVDKDQIIATDKPLSIFQLIVSTPFSRAYDSREILNEILLRKLDEAESRIDNSEALLKTVINSLQEVLSLPESDISGHAQTSVDLTLKLLIKDQNLKAEIIEKSSGRSRRDPLEELEDALGWRRQWIKYRDSNESKGVKNKKAEFEKKHKLPNGFLKKQLQMLRNYKAQNKTET